MSDEKRNLGASSSDDTSALFVTQRKKQIAEQEAQRKAAEEEAKRVAAEAEVRRLEAEVAARKQKAEEEARRIAQEAEERRRKAEEDARLEEERIAREAEERRRKAEEDAKAEAEAAAAAAKAKVEAAGTPAPEKENPLKKAAFGMKGGPKPEAGAPKKVPPMPPKGGPKPPMPKPPKPPMPKAPKPAKPAAPGDGTAAAKKPPIGLFVGIGVAVVAVIAIVLVFVLGGKKGSGVDYENGYQGWVAPLTISIDDYVMLDDDDREEIVNGMNAILEEELNETPFDRDSVDFTLVDYTSTDMGSAFMLAASEIAGMDVSGLVYGDTEGISDMGDILDLSVNDFTGSYFASKLGMTTLAQGMIVDAGWIDDTYNPIQLTADAYDHADLLDDDFDYDAMGGFVYCVAETLGLDGNAVYEDLDAAFVDGGEFDDTDDTDDTKVIDYDAYDDETGLCFKVYDMMPDAQVGGSLFNDHNEIGYVLRDESTLMSIFNMTNEYSEYNASDDEMVKAMTEIVIDNFVAQQFGAVSGYEYVGSTNNRGLDGTILADAGYFVDTQNYGEVSVFGQLRNVDNSGLIVLNVIMVRSDDGPALEAFGDMTDTQHIYEG